MNMHVAVKLARRLESINVMALAELPDDMFALVTDGLDSGRCLCIVTAKGEDGVERATWSFLNEKEEPNDQRPQDLL